MGQNIYKKIVIVLSMQLLYYEIAYFQDGCKQFLLTFYWMLEAAAKRHMSKKSISLDKCLSDEILDASQKMGIAC
jgi:ribosomal protein S7